MNNTEIPLKPALRWEWIKYQLRTHDSSLAKLARELDVSTQAVKNVKLTAYPRMERAIAEALSLRPIDLWPERWNANGTPHRTRPQRAENNELYIREHNPACALGHRKTARSA